MESRPGAGAVFRLYLPIATASERIPGGTRAPSPVTAPAQPRATVLVVEDDRATVRLLTDRLRESGYEVISALDGAQAVTLYREHKHRIDAVLLDLGLPKIAGWDVISQIKDENAQRKLIVTSGYIDPEFRAKIVGAGVTCFVDKPYLPDTILERLQRVIPACGPRRSLR